MLTPEEIEDVREILGHELTRKVAPVDLNDWLEDRRQNALRIAKTKRGGDRQGWLEDAAYLGRAVYAVERLIEASAESHANSPIRMHIALTVMRAWNSGTAGFSSDVVITVNQWIDNGMKGPVPWPKNPFFDEWAEAKGYQNIGGYIGFSFTA